MSQSRGVEYPLKEGFELVELPDGTQGKKWANGSITRLDGTIFAPSKNSVKIVTSEQGRAMVEKRHEKRKRIIAEHVRRATGAFSPDGALGKIAAKRAKVALTDEGRAGNDAAKFVFTIMDAFPEKTKNTTVVHQHELSPKAIEILKEVARLRNDPDIEYINGIEA